EVLAHAGNTGDGLVNRMDVARCPPPRLSETRRMDLRHRPTLLVARLYVAGDPAETGPRGIAPTLRHARHRTDGLANARGVIGRVLVHPIGVAELGFSTRHGRQLTSA